MIQEDPELTSCMDTLNVLLHMEQFPLRKTQKLAEQHLHIRQMRKTPH